MEIHLFNDDDAVPQPKNKVCIEALTAEPYADGLRVKVALKLSPFQERPNLAIVARSSDGALVSDLDIIATMHYDNEYTMHIRGLDDPSGNYTLRAELYYDSRNPPQDSCQVQFQIPRRES